NEQRIFRSITWLWWNPKKLLAHWISRQHAFAAKVRKRVSKRNSGFVNESRQHPVRPSRQGVRIHAECRQAHDPGRQQDWPARVSAGTNNDLGIELLNDSTCCHETLWQQQQATHLTAQADVLQSRAFNDRKFKTGLWYETSFQTPGRTNKPYD